MRISTLQIHQRAINSLLDQQTRVSYTQQQVASGKRILAPSDDPVASAQMLDLRETQATTERYQANAQAAEARLSLEESALQGVGEQLHRIRELAIRANNTTTTDRDRRLIAEEVGRIFDELLGLANTRDHSGDYLFSGYQGDTRPFARDPSGAVQYVGDDGQRLLQIGPSRQVADSDPGSKVFMHIKNGNGTFLARDAAGNQGSGVIDIGAVLDPAVYTGHDYRIDFTELPTGQLEYTVTDLTLGAVIQGPTSYQEGAAISFDGIQTTVSGTPADGDSFTITPSTNQSVFATVQEFLGALEGGTAGGEARLNNAINRVLAALDNAQENVLGVRARIGARLNAIDTQTTHNDNLILEVEKTLSSIEDLDYAEAVSRLNLQMVSLQAAQKAYTRVQGLSLFRYL